MDQVTKAHGTVLRFRKAAGFGRWLEEPSLEGPEMPWVLLTDWREVKPCLELLRASARQPGLILVHTSSEKQYKRSLEWKASMKTTAGDNLFILPPLCAVAEMLQM